MANNIFQLVAIANGYQLVILVDQNRVLVIIVHLDDLKPMKVN